MTAYGIRCLINVSSKCCWWQC